MSAAELAMMLLVSVRICHGQNPLTYTFPTDSCVTAPYLVDENTMIIMKFEGDFGGQECRKMSFTTPKSAFYSYTMSIKELYYSSQNCESTVYFKRRGSDNSYAYNNQISGDGCPGNTYMLYGNYRMFYECVDHASHVVFELTKTQEVFPDKVNDTFEFQIESKWHYNYSLIGGVVGMCVLTAVGTYVCINCRRRKRLTGRYCCACPTYRSKYSKLMIEGLAQGFSAECAVAGILLCSCVLCRRQTRNGQEEERCEKVIMETDYSSSDAENKWESVTVT